jgi:hypothetical protein
MLEYEYPVGMKYSEELKKRVHDEYPEDDTLKRFMERPDGYELRMLDELNSSGHLQIEEILEMINQGKIEELRKKAETIIRRKKLRDDCHNEMKRQAIARKEASEQRG